MNNANFAGNIGRVRPLATTQFGVVLNFSLAVKKRQKDQTLWIECAVWGDRASKLEPYLASGTKVAVNGEVDVSTYEKDGQVFPKMTLTVRELTMMGGGEGQQRSQQSAPPPQQSAPPQQQRQQTAPPPRQSAPAPQNADYDDDIPF